MPAGNGMGPQGMGPMTGRGAGFCAGVAQPGFAAGMGGRGCGLGAGRGRGAWGGGRGWRNMFRATGQPGWLRGAATPPEAAVRETQRATLERQQAALEASLADVRRRLDTVTGEASDPQS